MKVAGIRFHNQDKIYHFAQKGFTLKPGDTVVVETELGQEAGEIIYTDREIQKSELETPLKPILRKATLTDLEKIAKYRKKGKEAVRVCRELAKKHKLPMKIVDAHFTLDGSRIIFYFTAESRIDFRSLVRDLTHKFQKSIRLQQIGSRDVAARMGGIGICGRELCCWRFLKKFSSITTEMAKEQQMVQRGSERISGVCGRLLCCLAYEADLYEELNENMPELGTVVKTDRGEGRVISKNILNQTVEVEFDKEEKILYPVSEVKWKK